MISSLTCAPLRKSRKSGNTNCVCLGACDCHGGVIADSKDPSGPQLAVSVPAYRAFVAAAGQGRFR